MKYDDMIKYLKCDFKMLVNGNFWNEEHLIESLKEIEEIDTDCPLSKILITFSGIIKDNIVRIAELEKQVRYLENKDNHRLGEP